MHQIYIRRFADKCHYLADAELFCQHRRHDVDFVIIGNRAEGVGTLDVFLDQKVSIGRIA